MSSQSPITTVNKSPLMAQGCDSLPVVTRSSQSTLRDSAPVTTGRDVKRGERLGRPGVVTNGAQRGAMSVVDGVVDSARASSRVLPRNHFLCATPGSGSSEVEGPLHTPESRNFDYSDDVTVFRDAGGKLFHRTQMRTADLAISQPRHSGGLGMEYDEIATRHRSGGCVSADASDNASTTSSGVETFNRNRVAMEKCAMSEHDRPINDNVSVDDAVSVHSAAESLRHGTSSVLAMCKGSVPMYRNRLEATEIKRAYELEDSRLRQSSLLPQQRKTMSGI
jgi:hypothetical protein